MTPQAVRHTTSLANTRRTMLSRMLPLLKMQQKMPLVARFPPSRPPRMPFPLQIHPCRRGAAFHVVWCSVLTPLLPTGTQLPPY